MTRRLHSSRAFPHHAPPSDLWCPVPTLNTRVLPASVAESPAAPPPKTRQTCAPELSGGGAQAGIVMGIVMGKVFGIVMGKATFGTLPTPFVRGVTSALRLGPWTGQGAICSDARDLRPDGRSGATGATGAAARQRDQFDPTPAEVRQRIASRTGCGPR